MLYDLEGVKEFLPHRDPFLFVDCIESIETVNPVVPMDKPDYKQVIGAKCIGKYTPPKDHPIFKGHFPEYPIFPGVVQVEMMAQVSSFGITPLLERPFRAKIDVALIGLTGAKFRKPIFPEMELVIEGECLKSRGQFISFACRVIHEDQLMSEVEVTASVKI